MPNCCAAATRGWVPAGYDLGGRTASYRINRRAHCYIQTYVKGRATSVTQVLLQSGHRASHRSIRLSTSAFAFDPRNVCRHRPVDPLEIEGTTLGLEIASHVRPDRIADHDFARTCGGNEPRPKIHGLA